MYLIPNVIEDVRIHDIYSFYLDLWFIGGGGGDGGKVQGPILQHCLAASTPLLT